MLQSTGSQRVGYDLATEQQPPPITSKEVESVIKKNLLTKKSAGFTDKFYQPLKEELTSILLTLFQKHLRGGNAPTPILQGQH